MEFKKGQIYQNEDDNIFIKYVRNGCVGFIEGCSPCAIHDIEEFKAEILEEYIKKYGYKRASKEFEAFVNA